MGELASKPSLALRVCMVLLGVCLVFGTAALVIAGTSDDPPSARTMTSSLPPGFPAAPALTSTVTAEIANVPLVAPAAPADTTVALELGPEPSAHAVKAKPAPRTPSSGASSKALAPPPNPYEGAPAPKK